MPDTVTLTLAKDIWASLHAMANGQRGALHVERAVMQAFERALNAALQPAPEAAVEAAPDSGP